MKFLKKEVVLLEDEIGNLTVRKGDLRFSVLKNKKLFLEIFRNYEKGLSSEKIEIMLQPPVEKDIAHILFFFETNKLITNSEDYGLFDRQIRYLSVLNSTSKAIHELETQDKLENSSILIVGLGGLGSNIAVGLASVGVKRLGICDADLIEQSNLSRCIGYNIDDVGKSKSSSLKKYIEGLNHNCSIEEFNYLLDNTNYSLINDFDFVIITIDKDLKKDFSLINKICRSETPVIFANYGEQYGEISKVYLSESYRANIPEHAPQENITIDYKAPATRWNSLILSGIVIKEVVAYTSGGLSSVLSESSLRLNLDLLTITKI
jgi:molybdopterin/thiamine biosynthesis adenylyltransferase